VRSGTTRPCISNASLQLRGAKRQAAKRPVVSWKQWFGIRWQAALSTCLEVTRCWRRQAPQPLLHVVTSTGRVVLVEDPLREVLNDVVDAVLKDEVDVELVRFAPERCYARCGVLAESLFHLVL
jgi:hypothetical protein